jgi:hypothetical protein
MNPSEHFGSESEDSQLAKTGFRFVKGMNKDLSSGRRKL